MSKLGGERRTSIHLENANSEAIADLRREYKDDIHGIHDRIDQIFNILRKNTPNDYRAVMALGISLFVTIIFSLGTVLQIQLGASSEYQEKLQSYVNQISKDTDAELSSNINRINDEILRIRTWKDGLEGLIPKISNDVNWLRSYIDTKAQDRFTGKEGELLKERIDRLEKKLP